MNQQREKAPLSAADLEKLWVGAVAEAGEAANESEAMAKGVPELAGILEKKKPADVGQQVRSLVKKWGLSAKPMNGIDDLHHLFVLRRKGGLGVGAKPGVVRLDGIEAQIVALSEGRLKAQQLDAEAAPVRQMAFRTAAIAELTAASLPAGLQGQNTMWEEMSIKRQSALGLADAVQKKDLPGIRKSAQALDASCTMCHGGFAAGGINPFLPRPKPK